MKGGVEAQQIDDAGMNYAKCKIKSNLPYPTRSNVLSNEQISILPIFAYIP
jgi:hypothetical protein